MTRTERLTKLIARMPKDVREEVERLDAEVARLQEKLRENNAASYTSPVGIAEIFHEGNVFEQLHLPLPVDKAIRFYKKNLTPTQRKQSDCYVEVVHERKPDKGEKRLIIELHSGFSNMHIIPSSSNTIYITTDRD